MCPGGQVGPGVQEWCTQCVGRSRGCQGRIVTYLGTEEAGSGHHGLSTLGLSRVPAQGQPALGREGGSALGPGKAASAQRLRVLCKQLRCPLNTHGHF